MTINRIRAAGAPVYGRRSPACVTILLTGDHDGCRRTGRPQIPLLLVKPDAHRDTLGQTHPFEVRVYRRHPFRIAGTAGIRYPCRHAIDGTFNTRLLPSGVISARYPGRTPSSLVSSI